MTRRPIQNSLGKKTPKENWTLLNILKNDCIYGPKKPRSYLFFLYLACLLLCFVLFLWSCLCYCLDCTWTFSIYSCTFCGSVVLIIHFNIVLPGFINYFVILFILLCIWHSSLETLDWNRPILPTQKCTAL